MARISFRQGIVSHQTDVVGNPVFLNKDGAFVDLVVQPDPTIIAFIHGDSDYLLTETVSVPQAWGPLPNQTSWLFWDLDITTGEVTRDYTTLEPIESANQPVNPVTDQMWFNSQTNTWFEYNGATWIELIRVFAAQYVNAVSFQSMSINTPKFTGTQVGIQFTNNSRGRRVGSLVFGKGRKPLKNPGTNKFFTTEEDFVTGVPTAASLRINNQIITGTAVCPLAAYTVVQYNDFNSICVANPALEGVRLFGIIEEDAVTGEQISFITDGIVFNEDWDWIAAGGTANSPVYINSSGEITLANTSAQTRPVGFVFSRQEIFFAPRLFITQIINQGGGGGALTPAQLAQLNDNTTRSQSNQASIGSIINTTVPDLQSDITDAVADAAAASALAQQASNDVSDRVLRTGDSLSGKLTSPLTVISDPGNTLVTKNYVDDFIRGYQADFATGIWVGSGPRLFVIPASIHQLPLNTVYHITVLDNSSNSVVGIQTSIDKLTGLVTITTQGPAFAGTIRIT